MGIFVAGQPVLLSPPLSLLWVSPVPTVGPPRGMFPLPVAPVVKYIARSHSLQVLQELLRDMMGGSKAEGRGDDLMLLDALEVLPEAFTHRRLEDVHALVWLDENARAFRGQLGIFNRHFISYCAHMYLRPARHRAVPGLVSKPALQEVWESPVAYSAIARQLRGDGIALMLTAGMVGLGCIAAGTVAILSCRRR